MQNQPTEVSIPATRREFIKKTATMAAAIAAAPLLRPTVYGQAPSAGKVLGANDRINVGFIGVGGQGMNAHVNISSKNAAANNNFDATFSVDLARKDCGLAVQAGDTTGVHLPAARLALAQLDELIADGLGAKDCTLVAKLASPDGTLRGYDPSLDRTLEGTRA